MVDVGAPVGIETTRYLTEVVAENVAAPGLKEPSWKIAGSPGGSIFELSEEEKDTVAVIFSVVLVILTPPVE